MPERTTVTSGWSKSQRNAHSAAVQPRSFSAIRFFAFAGKRSTSLPPRSGSMMTIGMPFEEA